MQRNASVDSLKLLMALMVVGLHSGFMSDINKLAGYVFINGLFRIAVPTFLVINGFYFHKAVERGEALSWFKRVFILYVIWMVAYAWYWVPGPNSSATNILFKLTFGYYHLWYLSGMLAAAMIVMIINARCQKLMPVAAATTFLVGVALQYVKNYSLLDGSGLEKFIGSFWSHRNALLLSFPFFAAGFLVSEFSLQTRIRRPQAFLALTVGIFLVAIEAAVNFLQPGRTGGFDNLLSLAIACPALFIFAKQASLAGNSRLISQLAAGIYLVHILAINILSSTTSLKGTPLTFAVITASLMTTGLLVVANKRIKVIL